MRQAKLSILKKPCKKNLKIMFKKVCICFSQTTTSQDVFQNEKKNQNQNYC